MEGKSTSSGFLSNIFFWGGGDFSFCSLLLFQFNHSPTHGNAGWSLSHISTGKQEGGIIVVGRLKIPADRPSKKSRDLVN